VVILDTSKPQTNSNGALVNSVLIHRSKLVAAVEPQYAFYTKLSCYAGVEVCQVKVAVRFDLAALVRYLFVP